MLTLTFVLQQETKGALRYGEQLSSGRPAIALNDEGAVIGTLYVRKSAFPPATPWPKQLLVTIDKFEPK